MAANALDITSTGGRKGYDSTGVPVLFLVFNRPGPTREVFEALRKARPKRLFIAADGPRDNCKEDKEKSAETRAIVTRVDWPCDVKTLFREKNLGCARAVSEAITWFFTHVEEGIILEDDCLPSGDFFRFCAILLDKYRDDARVMQIGGNNLMARKQRDEDYSYFFSNHNYIWGWATWRRAWRLYRYNMDDYDVVINKHYYDHYFKSFYEQHYFRYVFDKLRADIDHASTWDYQWQYSRMLEAGLSIVPSRNLVINIGVGAEATHTSETHETISNLKLEAIDFPLRHPEFIMPDLVTDEAIFKRIFTTPWSRVKLRIRTLIPPFILRWSASAVHRPPPPRAG